MCSVDFSRFAGKLWKLFAKRYGIKVGHISSIDVKGDDFKKAWCVAWIIRLVVGWFLPIYFLPAVLFVRDAATFSGIQLVGQNMQYDTGRGLLFAFMLLFEFAMPIVSFSRLTKPLALAGIGFLLFDWSLSSSDRVTQTPAWADWSVLLATWFLVGCSGLYLWREYSSSKTKT